LYELHVKLPEATQPAPLVTHPVRPLTLQAASVVAVVLSAHVISLHAVAGFDEVLFVHATPEVLTRLEHPSEKVN
jgi:hypothetical protein